MKGGGCRDSFTAWQNCIEEADKSNEAQNCFHLRTCMLAHSDYYDSILRAEKAAEEEVVIELDNEKAAPQTPPVSSSVEEENSG
ncbi:hypothetical protein M0R45_018125 [Rubus argutus]|uniref:GCK domain-containing protein n=1 Tax=Rubus argutus TaxID=59490 RepID=A0AAW1X3D5_RUBAR